MERKGLFKLPLQILVHDIPKYLELKDYINYTSTCKYLNDNFEYSDIWKSVLKNKYSEDYIKLAKNEETSFNKFKYLVTLTTSYKNCNIAHRDSCWTERDDFISLNSVCWFHIIGKFDYVPDGKYVPEFLVKFKRRPLGLDRLEFIAKIIEMEIDPDELKQKEKEQSEVEENQDPAEETQHRDGEESNEENETEIVSQMNNSNRRTSLFDTVFRILPINRIIQSNKSKPVDAKNNEQKKELVTKEISNATLKFDRRILNEYKNDEWRVVESPEIIVDHSIIDQTKSRLRVQLEIKDLNGYWKNGISFKGMRLRKLVPVDSSSNTDNETEVDPSKINQTE